MTATDRVLVGPSRLVRAPRFPDIRVEISVDASQFTAALRRVTDTMNRFALEVQRYDEATARRSQMHAAYRHRQLARRRRSRR